MNRVGPWVQVGVEGWQPAPSSPPLSSPGHTHPFIREWIKKAEYILGKDCVYIIFPFFCYFVFNVLLSWKFSFVDELKIATILRGNLNNSWKEGRFCTFYQEWRILLRGLGILKTLPLLWRGPQEYRIKQIFICIPYFYVKREPWSPYVVYPNKRRDKCATIYENMALEFWFQRCYPSPPIPEDLL